MHVLEGDNLNEKVLSYIKNIASKHMSFWCMFLDAHLTTHHSNMSV